jgi:hypothetical protein
MLRSRPAETADCSSATSVARTSQMNLAMNANDDRTTRPHVTPPTRASSPVVPRHQHWSRDSEPDPLLAAVARLHVDCHRWGRGLLWTIFEHKREARTPFVRVAAIDETTTDPAPWGLNWPHHFYEYKLSEGPFLAAPAPVQE